MSNGETSFHIFCVAASWYNYTFYIHICTSCSLPYISCHQTVLPVSIWHFCTFFRELIAQILKSRWTMPKFTLFTFKTQKIKGWAISTIATHVECTPGFYIHVLAMQEDNEPPMGNKVNRWSRLQHVVGRRFVFVASQQHSLEVFNAGGYQVDVSFPLFIMNHTAYFGLTLKKLLMLFIPVVSIFFSFFAKVVGFWKNESKQWVEFLVFSFSSSDPTELPDYRIAQYFPVPDVNTANLYPFPASWQTTSQLVLTSFKWL